MSDLNDPRVLFAAERTLLAWNRTSLSLIAFGFLVERSGILLDELQDIAAPQSGMLATFLIGLAFILLGVFAAIYSSRQYTTALKALKPSEFPPGYATKGGLWVNVGVAMLGLLLTATLYLTHA